MYYKGIFQQLVLVSCEINIVLVFDNKICGFFIVLCVDISHCLVVYEKYC